MKRIFTINKFPGLIEAADTRDVQHATTVENADVTSALGILQPSKGYSDLGVDFNSSTIRQFIEYLNPQHGAEVKVLFVRKGITTISFSLDIGSGFRAPESRLYVGATPFPNPFN